jgi:flagellar hook-associated protein 3 FlgL
MSTAIGLPDILTNRRSGVAQSRLKRELEIAGKEVATGIADDRVKASGGDTARLMSIERGIGTIEARLPYLNLAASRAATTQASLVIVQDGAAQRAVRLMDSELLLRGGAQDVRVVESESALRTTLATLNTTAGGRALFAGANTDGPAVLDYDAVVAGVLAALDAAPDAATGVADAQAWVAANVPLAVGAAPGVEIADGERVRFAVDSADPGVLAIITGDALMVASAQSVTFAGDEAALATIYTAAGQSLLSGDTQTTQTRGRLGAAEERIENAIAGQQAERTSLSLIRNQLAGVDEFEAATRLRQIETQLESLYLITARASQLSFANFIR